MPISGKLVPLVYAAGSRTSYERCLNDYYLLYQSSRYTSSRRGCVFNETAGRPGRELAFVKGEQDEGKREARD